MSNYKDNNGGRTRRRKRMRTHGFLKRMLTPGGKNTIKRRRAKGRHRLVVSSKAWSFSRR